MNYVENLPIYLTLVAFAGLNVNVSLATLILASFIFILRIIYTIGYLKKGPDYRIAGSLPTGLILFALFGMSIYTAIEFMKNDILK